MPVKSRGGKRLWKRLAISGSGTRREDERVNHSLRIENLNDDIETGVGRLPWDNGASCDVSSAGERPVCGLGGVRCKGGVSPSQALAWNRRTCRLGTVGQGVAPWLRETGERREKPANARCSKGNLRTNLSATPVGSSLVPGSARILGQTR